MIGFIKQDFVKKGGLTKTFLIKRGVGAKGGGGLERFCILRGGWPKRWGGGVHTLVLTMVKLFSGVINN